MIGDAYAEALTAIASSSSSSSSSAHAVVGGAPGEPERPPSAALLSSLYEALRSDAESSHDGSQRGSQRSRARGSPAAAREENARRSAAEARLCSALAAGGMDAAHARVLVASLCTRRLRIGFYSNQLSERGTETALYDYAHYSEALLGATAYILYDATSPKNLPASVAKFRARFGERVRSLGAAGGEPLRDLPAMLARDAIRHCYVIKFGAPDEPALAHFGRTRTMVHAVFDARAPHGSVFARISPCVPSVGAAPAPVVPHIVRRARTDGADMRAELGIPPSATVFGRYGGTNVFDIFEVRAAVMRVARARPQGVYFLLMNTEPMALRPGETAPPNIVYLPASLDDERKAAFIRTCDAMLHARWSGESFGLAVAEFSAAGKPVITSSVHDDDGMARFHIDALGRRGLFYHDGASCERALLEFDAREARRHDWNAYRPYEPEAVMVTFRDVFLSDCLRGGPPVGGAGGAGGAGLVDGPLGGADEAAAAQQYERLQLSGAAMPCCGWGLPQVATAEEERRRQAAFEQMRTARRALHPLPRAATAEPLAVAVEGGLCNRLRVALSFLAAARAEGRALLVVWPADDAACPGHFTDCFEPPADMTLCERAPPGTRVRPPPPHADFHPSVKHSAMEVRMYAALSPTAAVRAAVTANVTRLRAAAVGGAAREAGADGADGEGESAPRGGGEGEGASSSPAFHFAAVHVRRTDHWGTGVADGEYLAFVRAQPRGTVAYAAVDNAMTQARFLADAVVGPRVRPAAKRIREHADGDGLQMTSGPFGRGRTVRHTSLTDAAIDLLTCAAADGPFMGSPTSSFSDTIGRLRRLHGRVHPADNHRFVDLPGQPNLSSFAHEPRVR